MSENEFKPRVEIVDEEMDIEQELDDQLKNLIPRMEVSPLTQNDVCPPIENQETPPDIVEVEEVKEIYDEIITNLREDRQEAGEGADKFAEMVFNGGDASSASKEAFVALMKLKHDATDKLIKMADLKTRVVMKAKDTFIPYLNAQQHNTININRNPTSNRREILEAIEKKEKLKLKKD